MEILHIKELASLLSAPLSFPQNNLLNISQYTTVSNYFGLSKCLGIRNFNLVFIMLKFWLEVNKNKTNKKEYTVPLRKIVKLIRIFQFKQKIYY